MMIEASRRLFSASTRRSQMRRKAGQTTPVDPRIRDSKDDRVLSKVQLKNEDSVMSPIVRMEALVLGATSNVPENLRLHLEAIEFASVHRFRTPLRDIASSAIPSFENERLSNDPLFIDDVVRILSLTGQGMVYFQELFDFLLKHRNQLTASHLSTLIYECGRHGLRSKHFLDTILKSVSDKTVNQMNSEEVCRALMGVCKFSADYSDFVELCAWKLDPTKLRPQEVLVAIRAFRPAGREKPLIKLLEATKWSKFSQVETLNAIHLLKRAKKHPLGPRSMAITSRVVDGLMRGLYMNEINDGNIIVTDVSDCLDSLASWRKRDPALLKVYMDFLTDRVAEIKYSPICGLWQAITDSCGHLEFFHGPWMRIVEDIASSEFNLKTFATFQLIFFISSLGRLNFYSEKVYRAVASVIATDVSSVRDLDMLVTALFPFERAALRCDDLVDATLRQACAVIGGESSPDRKKHRNVTEALKILHSSMILGSRNHDKHVQRLSMLVSSKLGDCYEQLGSVDKVRVARLAHLGFLQLDKPRNFRMEFWVTDAKREDSLVALRETLEPCDVPFVDFKRLDGKLVVLESHEEPLMTWEHPDDHRSYELCKLEGAGFRRLIAEYLVNQGHHNVEFIH